MGKFSIGKKCKAFSLIELFFMIFIIVLIAIVSIPMIIDNTQEAELISRWKSVYSEFKYIYKTIHIQNTDIFNYSCKGNVDKTSEIFNKLMNYLNADSEKKEYQPENYKYKFLNNKKVTNTSMYYVDTYAITDNGTLIGFKWFNDCECSAKKPCGIFLFDINGVKSPNKFGNDIFGVNIYKNSLEPFGYGEDEQTLQDDCGNYGSGVKCSQYYLIGGKF